LATADDNEAPTDDRDAVMADAYAILFASPPLIESCDVYAALLPAMI